MIPQELKKEWEKAQNRAEVLFLADHGGGVPDCLGAGLRPEDRMSILRSLGFRLRERYEMPRDLLLPSEGDNLVPYVRLTNQVSVDLETGFVTRSQKRGHGYE